MDSVTVARRLYSWATTQRNLTIFVAILVAVPTAYAFQTRTAGGEHVGNFLLLMTLAVGVPTAYDEYWPQYDRTWKALAWVVAACAIATTEFTGLYLVGVEIAELTPNHAAVGSFIVTDLGNVAWLSIRQT